MAKVVINSSPSGKTPKRRRSPHDASLLFCCMDVLQIDHGRLAQDEPLLYRELQGVCSLCPNKRDCASDLTDGFGRMRWDEWWLYCPNSAMLTTITTARTLLVVFSSPKSNDGFDNLPRRHVTRPNYGRQTAYLTKLRWCGRFDLVVG